MRWAVEVPKECPYCGKKKRSWWDVCDHITEAHSEKRKSTRCAFCDVRFPSGRQGMVHYLEKHPSDLMSIRNQTQPAGGADMTNQIDQSLRSIVEIARVQAEALSAELTAQLRDTAEAKRLFESLGGAIDLRAVLLELADADVACSQHFKAHPVYEKPEAERDPEQARIASEAWTLVHRRREAAVSTLVQLSRYVKRLG